MGEHIVSVHNAWTSSVARARAIELPALIAGAYARGAAAVQVDSTVIDPPPRAPCVACSRCGGFGYELRHVEPLRLSHCSVCVVPRSVPVPLGIALPDAWRDAERSSRRWSKAVIGLLAPIAVAVAVLAIAAWMRTHGN